MTFLERVNTITNGELCSSARRWVKKNLNTLLMDQTAYNTTQWILEENPEEDATAWIGPLVSGDIGKGPHKETCLVADVIGYSLVDILDEWKDNLEAIPAFIHDSNTFNLACAVIAEELNTKTTLPKSDGRYWIGEHEADGSLGILYTRKAGK